MAEAIRMGGWEEWIDIGHVPNLFNAYNPKMFH